MRKSELDLRIKEILEFLENKDPSDPAYSTAVDNLNVLYGIRSNKGTGPGKDVIFMGAVSFMQLMMVLYFEKFDIVTSKSFNWIKRVW